MFDKPFPFLDSDVYKWLEGAGWELGRAPDERIRAMADEAIGLVEAAQRPDGYLNTFVQVLAPGSEYRDLQWGHELYCVGHLVQAAVAWHRALGDDRLLLVAERALCLRRARARARRPRGDRRPSRDRDGARRAVPGRPASGAGSTSRPSFIDRRGRGLLGDGRFGRGYWQDHLPVREAPAVAGHAVRQLYLDCGAVDVAVETGDDASCSTRSDRRWRDMVATQDVPHRRRSAAATRTRRSATRSSCRRTAPTPRRARRSRGVMLAWRLLLATGDPACADLIERTLYNAVLPSLSTDGHVVLLREPAPAPDAPDVDRRRARASGRRGMPAPAARRT